LVYGNLMSREIDQEVATPEDPNEGNGPKYVMPRDNLTHE